MVTNSSLSDEILGASNANIGMDYTTKSMTGNQGFFETLITQKKVREPEFAFWIARSHGSMNSELVLGGRDTTKFTGEPIVANVTSQNYWTIYVDGASVNGTNINNVTGGNAIVDTGNPGISCHLRCAEAINTRIPLARLLPSSNNESAAYAYPCNTSAEYIPVINIAGQSLAIDPLDFNAGPVDSATISQMDGLPNGIVFCTSQIIGSSDRHWFIGLPFMHSWYTIFHWGAKTIGSEVGVGTAVIFAKNIQPPTCTTSPNIQANGTWTFDGCWTYEA